MWDDPFDLPYDFDDPRMTNEMCEMLDAMRMNSMRPVQTQERESGGRVVVVYKGQDWTRIPRNVTHARIHPSVKVIKSCAFNRCANLVEVEMNEILQVIGPSAFSDCVRLERIKGGFPSTLEQIESEAFLCCKKLKELDFPEGLAELEYSSFSECINLERVKFSGKVIGRMAFEGCTKLLSVELSEGLTEVDSCAFQGCTSLRRIALPSTVKKVLVNHHNSSYNSFEDCTEVIKDGEVMKMCSCGHCEELRANNAKD